MQGSMHRRVTFSLSLLLLERNCALARSPISFSLRQSLLYSLSASALLLSVCVAVLHGPLCACPSDSLVLSLSVSVCLLSMFTALLVALEDAATPADVVAAKLQEAGPRLALLSKAFAGPDATGRAGLAAAAAKTPTWLTVPASDQQAAAILLSQLLVRGVARTPSCCLVPCSVAPSPAPSLSPLPRRPPTQPPLPHHHHHHLVARPPALSLLTRPIARNSPRSLPIRTCTKTRRWTCCVPMSASRTAHRS